MGYTTRTIYQNSDCIFIDVNSWSIHVWKKRRLWHWRLRWMWIGPIEITWRRRVMVRKGQAMGPTAE